MPDGAGERGDERAMIDGAEAGGVIKAHVERCRLELGQGDLAVCVCVCLGERVKAQRGRERRIGRGLQAVVEEVVAVGRELYLDARVVRDDDAGLFSAALLGAAFWELVFQQAV